MHTNFHKKLFTVSNSLRVVLILAGIVIAFPSYSQFSCSGLITTDVQYTGGPQTFIVPSGVTQVRISITGASGGEATLSSAYKPGGGATVYAYITVVMGDVFRVIIGEKGKNGRMESGGGGASAVYKNGILIMVAGGGGGEDNTGNGGNGRSSTNGGNGGDDGSVGSSDGCGSSTDNGKGGTGGNGGNHGEFSKNCPHGGGGGGGLLSNGQGNGNINAGQPGKKGDINGVTGGQGSQDDAATVQGGWGWASGGGADYRESGGGGGYSGGGGGPESTNPGGGGSFVAAIGTNGIFISDKSDGTNPNSSYNGYGTICSLVEIVLPVTYKSFTAESTTVGNLLKWEMSSEQNISHYEVERSADGINFTNIGIMAVAGNNASTNKYQFLDNTSPFESTYYQIKSVDRNSRISYSSIRFIKGRVMHDLISAYPNPAFDVLKIVLPQTWKNSKSIITIMNANGQALINQTVNTAENKFNVKSLPKGVYIIKAINITHNQQLSLKFLKN
ncbi:MAG: T9SS type A sorting domain-containing protein [Chitinophagaceae bacterium]|nr:T9SS type A sorting domain-containing protein [Chitinophagaceae bacterium]MCW5916588.1 T9SS type A sorting domain-containing protein [Ferruginibacter sp.]